MFSNQWVNHFIDTLSTNTVVPVVGWVEAIAETHHIHPPAIDGPRCALPILRGLALIRPRDVRNIQTQLTQCLKVACFLGGVQDLYTYQVPILVIIEDDAIGYFLTAVDL